MIGVIWSGATTASDVFLLVAVIVAGILTVIEALTSPTNALLPAAVALIALGLLAL